MGCLADVARCTYLLKHLGEQAMHHARLHPFSVKGWVGFSLDDLYEDTGFLIV